MDSLAPEKAPVVDVWTKKTLTSLLTPGGWVLLGMAIILHTGVVSIPLPVVTFLYYGAFTAGLLLAWRIPFQPHLLRAARAISCPESTHVFSRRTYS